MRKEYKKIVFLLVAIILGICAMIAFNGCSSEQSPTISYINDVEQFCKDHNISNVETSGIQYYQTNANSVFVLDQRNSDKSLYIHSNIEASVNQDGKLIVRVVDSTAISENDISGNYAVLIASKTAISKIEIEQEDKTK
ncbi:MAG: hypothetical protein LIP01_04760 [Tannerellaceae bacterium]|nr:hypothetical protein [Tannerellaceae bacterium]